MRHMYLFLKARAFLVFGFLLYAAGSVREAIAAPSYPEEWVLGDRLLVGALFLIVIGFLTGAFALLMGNVAPMIKRSVIYPLFKVTGVDGDKKPLIIEK